MTALAVLYAIDPGRTGAIAAFRNGELADVVDPASGCLALPLDAELRQGGDVRVVVEQVQGFPGQSASASFVFGRLFGELLGVCMAHRIAPELIAPSVWKAGVGLRRGRSMTQVQWKAASLDRARALWPSAPWFDRAKDDGRAEAALLGHYALTQGLLA